MNDHELIKEYGTPFYLFDTLQLKKRIEMIKEHQTGIRLCYAMKAGPYLTKYAAKYVDRLEVCSPGEYEICVRDGIAPEKILVSGVNKTRVSIKRILSLGGAAGFFSIESPEQLDVIENAAREFLDSNESFSGKLRCYIRLSSGNQFGVDKKTFEELCEKVINSEVLELVGIHYFSGTQKSLKKIEKELSELAEFGEKLNEKFGDRLGDSTKKKLSLEYGPGLGIDYYRNDDSMLGEEELPGYNESYIEELMKLVENTGLRKVFGKMTFEYGRYIAATCGRYFTSVVDVKKTDDTNFAILDGGLHQITYYGSMAGMKVPYVDLIPGNGKVVASDEEGSNMNEDYVLAGSLCSVNDILVRRIALPTLDIGDTLCFNLAGAYCATEGISLFLSRDLPAIVIRDEDGAETLIRDHIEINTFNGGYNG